jgi:hypothetical protein
MALLAFYVGLIMGGLLGVVAMALFFLRDLEDEPDKLPDSLDRYWPLQPEGFEAESHSCHRSF